MDVDRLWGAVIVSCQAEPGSPLRGPAFMAAMAQAAELGGARGIRAEGVDDIAAIRAVTDLPLIGIRKASRDTSAVYITPGFDDAKDLVAAGADVIATDGTPRSRPHGERLTDLIRRVHELGVTVMADVDSLESARYAAAAGADLVATTLSGYTRDDLPPKGPDVQLVRELVAAQRVPVVAEGRFWTPDQVSAAFDAGAYAVVVGTAITSPLHITRRFVAATPTRNQ